MSDNWMGSAVVCICSARCCWCALEFIDREAGFCIGYSSDFISIFLIRWFNSTSFIRRWSSSKPSSSLLLFPHYRERPSPNYPSSMTRDIHRRVFPRLNTTSSHPSTCQTHHLARRSLEPRHNSRHLPLSAEVRPNSSSQSMLELQKSEAIQGSSPQPQSPECGETLSSVAAPRAVCSRARCRWPLFSKYGVSALKWRVYISCLSP